MQPTWSDGSPFSIADSATTGCHAVWLLKSRRMAHTRSIGASMIADRVTRITGGTPPSADRASVLQAEVAHAADSIGREPALDARLRDERRPLRQAVEVANVRPHGVG